MTLIGTRVCTECKQEKTLGNFPKPYKQERGKICNTCIDKLELVIYIPGDEHLLKDIKRVSLKQLRREKIKQLRYHQQLVKQKYCCAICKVPETESKLFLNFSKGGRLKGLICQRCSTILGLLKHDKSIIRALLHYLRR